MGREFPLIPDNDPQLPYPAGACRPGSILQSMLPHVNIVAHLSYMDFRRLRAGVSRSGVFPAARLTPERTPQRRSGVCGSQPRRWRFVHAMT